jgi:hypothetical protein
VLAGAAIAAIGLTVGSLTAASAAAGHGGSGSIERPRRRPTCTAPTRRPARRSAYKSGTRAHIASLGYSIMADFGDQYSDLLGGNAGHQVKVPNPMYYIP